MDKKADNTASNETPPQRLEVSVGVEKKGWLGKFTPFVDGALIAMNAFWIKNDVTLAKRVGLKTAWQVSGKIDKFFAITQPLFVAYWAHDMYNYFKKPKAIIIEKDLLTSTPLSQDKVTTPPPENCHCAEDKASKFSERAAKEKQKAAELPAH